VDWWRTAVNIWPTPPRSHGSGGSIILARLGPSNIIPWATNDPKETCGCWPQRPSTPIRGAVLPAPPWNTNRKSEIVPIRPNGGAQLVAPSRTPTSGRRRLHRDLNGVVPLATVMPAMGLFYVMEKRHRRALGGGREFSLYSDQRTINACFGLPCHRFRANWAPLYCAENY